MSGREAPERDYEAQQEQEVVDALEDVPEARDEEAQRRLMPARIEAHEAGVAVQLEGAHVAARRQETQGRRHPLAEAVDARMRSAKAERSERIGYSSSTSSSCWLQ